MFLSTKKYYTPLVNKRAHSIKKGGFIVTLFVVFGLLQSCGGDDIVASVDGHELHREDARYIMEEMGYDTQNSEDWSTFVDSWTRAQLMRIELEELDNQNMMLTKHRSEMFEGELAEYYMVESELNKQVDSTISEEEIKNYYDLHKDEFELNDFIIRGLFMKVTLNCPKLDVLKRIYLLKNDKDLAQVESIAKLYAEDFYFDDENWVFADNVLNRFPMRSLNKESLVLNRTKTYLSDEKFVYFLNVMDYKLKNEQPPLDFVRQQIKDRLLASRLSEKRKGVQNELLKKLKLKHDIQNYL